MKSGVREGGVRVEGRHGSAEQQSHYRSLQHTVRLLKLFCLPCGQYRGLVKGHDDTSELT
jgi:hypothetical protein